MRFDCPPSTDIRRVRSRAVLYLLSSARPWACQRILGLARTSGRYGQNQPKLSFLRIRTLACLDCNNTSVCTTYPCSASSLFECFHSPCPFLSLKSRSSNACFFSLARSLVRSFAPYRKLVYLIRRSSVARFQSSVEFDTSAGLPGNLQVESRGWLARLARTVRSNGATHCHTHTHTHARGV